MENPDRYQSKDLRVHRNYVLVVSFILLFMTSGGVSIEKINFLGATFTFENINAIYWALWTLLFYSLLRYWQYFNTQSTGGGLIQPYKEHRELLFKEKIKQIVDSNILEKNAIEDAAQIQYPSYNHLKKKSKWSLKTQLVYTILKGDGGFESKRGHEIQFNILKDFGFLYIKLWFLFLINRPAIFEFVFPFILGILTIIYCNLVDWPGALLNLI